MSTYDLEREQILRRRKVAEAMIAQSQAPFAGTQMVSGIAVKRSPFEGLAKVAQAYAGNQAQKKADDEVMGLRNKEREDIASAMGDYQRATTARPGSSEQIVDETANDGMGENATITAPGYTPDAGAKRSAAFDLMTKIGSGKDMAKMMVAEALKPAEKTKYHVVAGNLVPEPDIPMASVKPVYTAPVKPEAAPSSIKEYEYAKGQGFAGTFEEFELARKRAGASNIKLTATAGTEKKYGEQFAGAVATQDVALLDAARKAPELATRANQVKEILASGKVITGAGADVRLQLGKALGLVGASDAETVSNTEALSVNLARNTLDAIKASGLGSGTGFSNADRDFLEKAAGGKINLEGTTIGRLADLSHRAANLSAEAWNKRAKDIPDSALGGTGIKRDSINVSPLYGGKTRPRISPEAQKYLDMYAPEGQ